MSKAVLISIRPKWVEKIASGEKTIEVRKTKPKLETPFKCYIYCTMDHPYISVSCGELDKLNYRTNTVGRCNGKVIGEFTCDLIQSFDSAYSEWAYAVAPSGSVMPMHETKALELCKKDGCLSDDDVLSYFGDEDWKAYFWHIADLRIYDTPKELSEFKTLCRVDADCCACPYYNYTKMDCDGRVIGRPPQSWCYVDDVQAK